MPPECKGTRSQPKSQAIQREKEAKQSDGPNKERQIVLLPQCLEDLQYRMGTEWRNGKRALDLIEETMRTPFEGTGLPEHLKYLGGNVWSRRITQTDRLVYEVYDDRISFLQARYHYSEE